MLGGEKGWWGDLGKRIEKGGAERRGRTDNTQPQG